MGTIRHRLLIGTAPALEPKRSEWVAKLDAWRNKLPKEWKRLVIGPVQGIVNDDWWVVFLPDGSKEWWSDSQEGYGHAGEFAALFPEHEQPIELTFGDEEPAAQVGLSWGDVD